MPIEPTVRRCAEKAENILSDTDFFIGKNKGYGHGRIRNRYDPIAVRWISFRVNGHTETNIFSAHGLPNSPGILTDISGDYKAIEPTPRHCKRCGIPSRLILLPSK